MVSMRKNDQSVDWRGVKSPAMVCDTVQLEKCTKYSDNDNGDECDDVSVVSSTDSRVECDGAVVLNDVQDRSPCFQNIEVTNSSDVHFGNKTYYQGPVTIKQILYTNPSNTDEEPSDQKLPITDTCGTNNNGFIPDSSNEIIKNTNVNNNNSHNTNWTNKTQGKKWLQRRTSKQLILGTAILILIMVAIIASTIAFLTKYIPKNQLQVYDEENESNKPNNDPEVSGSVNIISRRVWVAEPPYKTAPLQQPVSKILIVETFTQNCTTQADCIFVVRHLQTSHKEGSSLWDIKYNFLVGGDGNVYEGRGWDNIGASIPKCNKNSIGIALVGTFSLLAPPDRQINSAKRLIGVGIKRNHISPDYKIVYASQILGEHVGSSKKLEEIVKTWSHWSNVDYFHNDTLKQNFCNS